MLYCFQTTMGGPFAATEWNLYTVLCSRLRTADVSLPIHGVCAAWRSIRERREADFHGCMCGGGRGHEGRSAERAWRQLSRQRRAHGQPATWLAGSLTSLPLVP